MPDCHFVPDSTSSYNPTGDCNDYLLYMPDSDFNYQNTPILTVRLNFHFLRKPNGSGIYANDQSQNVAEIIQNLNIFYGNINDPVLEVTPPAETIDDTRIRFVEFGIHYHVNDDDYESSVRCESYYQDNYGIDTEQIVNIFFYTNDDYSGTNGCGPRFYVNMFNYFNNYPNMRLLAHELGHVLFLDHTFSGCTYDDVLSDTYHPDLNRDWISCGANETYYLPDDPPP